MSLIQRENPARAVLVLNDEKQSELFNHHLRNTLNYLACESLFTTEWKTAFCEMETRPGQQDLIIVDPSVRGFSADQFREFILKRQEYAKVRVVLLRTHADDDMYHLEEKLDVDGIITRAWAPHQLTFVFQRLLFPSLQNRRLHIRGLASLVCEYALANTKVKYREETVNMSVGGFFLRSYKPLDPGAMVQVKMEIPDDPTPAECLGKVVFQSEKQSQKSELFNPTGMGISIEEIRTTDRSRIFDFLQSRLLRSDRRATSRSMIF